MATIYRSRISVGQTRASAGYSLPLRILVLGATLGSIFAVYTIYFERATHDTPRPPEPQQVALSSSSFLLWSPAFENGQIMPSVFSRTEGDNISPGLVWSGAPTSTQSLALIVDDPDAPDPANPKTTWVHWVLYNIIPQSNQEQPQTLAQGDTSTGTVTLNDWKQRQYDGPDPPIGSHRYFFRLYALDTILEEAGIVDKQSLLAAAEGHVLAATDLIGRYQKSV